MTTPTFEDLEKFGIVDGPIGPQEFELDEEFEDIDVTDEELVEFLAQSGIEIPENPSEGYIDDLNTLLQSGGYVAHWGVLGMKWGRRKDRDGVYRNNPGRMAGNHPGHGASVIREGVVTIPSGSKRKIRVGDTVNGESYGRGTVTKVTKTEIKGRFKVEVNYPNEKLDQYELPPEKGGDRAPKAAPERASSATSASLPKGVDKADFDRRTDEIASVIRRMEQEAKYAQLTAPKKSQTETIVQKILIDGLTKSGTQLVSTGVSAVAREALKKVGELQKKKS